MTFYKPVSVGGLTQAQITKAAKGQAVTLSASQLQGSGFKLHVHPEVAAKIAKAKRAHKGTRVNLSPEGLSQTAELEGGSLGDWIKKAFSWGKKNWDVLKPVASRLADVAVPALATAFGQPMAGVAARGALKQLTGVGLKKGSPEMKAHMANLRSKRRGGSFRLS